MASEVKSGPTNFAYVNNHTQNVRLIINYMANVTSMTWSSSSGGTVNVTATRTTIGKDIQNINGELRQAVPGTKVREFVSPNAGANPNQLLGSLYNAEIASTKAYLLGSNDLLSSRFGEAYMPSSLVPGNQLPPLGSIPLVTVGGTPDPGNTFYQSLPYTAGSSALNKEFSPNLFYVPLTISRGGNFPVELMLAPNQSFSAICGPFNAIVIKEDGT
jgi:hypothetical protein